MYVFCGCLRKEDDGAFYPLRGVHDKGVIAFFGASLVGLVGLVQKGGFYVGVDRKKYLAPPTHTYNHCCKWCQALPSFNLSHSGPSNANTGRFSPSTVHSVVWRTLHESAQQYPLYALADLHPARPSSLLSTTIVFHGDTVKQIDGSGRILSPTRTQNTSVPHGLAPFIFYSFTFDTTRYTLKE